MIAPLLASWLTTQEWSWDRAVEEDVVAYRIYFSAGPNVWCAQDRVEVPATQCDATRCWGDVDEPGWSPAFFIITAVDAAGNESDTDHGEVTPCP